jgi:hypothetical protein
MTCVQRVARGGVEPPTFRFSVGRSYQLSYLADARRSGWIERASTPYRSVPVPTKTESAVVSPMLFRVLAPIV